MVEFKNAVYAYIRKNAILLTVLLIIFLAGVVFGTLGVIFLDSAQTKEISFFVEKVFSETTTVDTGNILSIINTNVKLMTIIWFLGLTIIGIPLVAAVVFTRGFALGFTSSFIIKMKGIQGTLAVILAVFPPNLFATPLLLFAGANSIVFSLCLLKRTQKEISLGKNFLAFTFSMLMLALLSAGVGTLQGFLSPIAVKVVSYTYGR